VSAQNVTAGWAATSDEQLKAAVKAGSRSAFDVLYDPLRPSPDRAS
jgi:hypothetical protein